MDRKPSTEKDPQAKKGPKQLCLKDSDGKEIDIEDVNTFCVSSDGVFCALNLTSKSHEIQLYQLMDPTT